MTAIVELADLQEILDNDAGRLECYIRGHALYVVGGALQPNCLRCGDDLSDTLPSSPECPVHGDDCEAWS